VALTNAPRTNNIKPLLAKLGAEHQKKEKSMSLEKVIAKLGLPADADEAAVMDALEKLAEKAQKDPGKPVIAKEILDALKLETGGVSEVVASIHALKQNANTAVVSRAEFEELQQALARKNADEIVAKALREGKITPDQKEWADAYAMKDPEGFAYFVSKAVPVIPVRKAGDTVPRKPDKITEDETVMEVARMMGITKEDIEKYGGNE
jgi:phage I-like protein